MFIIQLLYSDYLKSLDIQIQLPWTLIYVWISLNTNPFWVLLFDLFYCTLCYYKTWQRLCSVWKIWGVFLWCFTLCENILKKVVKILYDYMFSNSIGKCQVSLYHFINESWYWSQILYIFKVDCQILNLLPYLNCQDLISCKYFLHLFEDSYRIFGIGT